MNDTTSYADKLPPSLNDELKKFTGNECVMVRYLKVKGKPIAKAGNCHLNVKSFVDSHGGKAVSGWIFYRDPELINKGLYVWIFHSIWEMPDGKWVDVTEDKRYKGRDKSIFVPDAVRLPDMVAGLTYNNFMIFTEPKFAAEYGNYIGENLRTNEIYWTDPEMLRIRRTEQFNGIYRLISPDYPNNIKILCEEYEVDIVNGNLVPKPGSKYAEIGAFPAKIFFDYSFSGQD